MVGERRRSTAVGAEGEKPRSIEERRKRARTETTQRESVKGRPGQRQKETEEKDNRKEKRIFLLDGHPSSSSRFASVGHPTGLSIPFPSTSYLCCPLPRSTKNPQTTCDGRLRPGLEVIIL